MHRSRESGERQRSKDNSNINERPAEGTEVVKRIIVVEWIFGRKMVRQFVESEVNQ